MKRSQSGFTLIEIAIVLVIIGLLLGGVLKGQELINSAKVKNLATDFKNVPIYIYGYQDKYKALPGDDANVTTHLGASATPGAPASTLGNGLIDGNWDDGVPGSTVAANTASESFVFWQHIRMAGFGPGATLTSDPAYLPTNAVGGHIGVTNSVTNNPTAANGTYPALVGTYIVCSDSIPGKFAKQLDTTLDDGNTQTGSVMVVPQGTTTGGTPVATTAIVDDQTYLVCMGY